MPPVGGTSSEEHSGPTMSIVAVIGAVPQSVQVVT